MTLSFEAMPHNRFVQRHSCPLFRCGFLPPSAGLGEQGDTLPAGIGSHRN